MKKCLCIIPARGGSKRIPHKNIADFKGAPIISYSIKAVQESGIADEIMVSTDDPVIAEVAKQYGAKVPFLRDASTSNDTAGVAAVLVEVVNEYQKQGMAFEYVLAVELKQLHPENYYARSQDLQPIYHDCNQFFLFKTYALLRDQKLYTEHTLPFILAESESQDIDTMEDWKLMEMKYDLMHQKD